MPLPGSGWAVVADLSNRAPGPWDQGRLPVDELQADALWQDDTATVRTLKARTGGGTLQVTGQWHRAAAAGAPPWRLDARLDGVDPARLHRQLAALPVDGTARLGGAGSATDFDVALQARPTRATPPPRAGESAAQARARELRALRLHSASAQGRWDAGLLRLDELRLRTDDAELAGTARLHLQGADSPAGQADLRLTAPGLRARTQGELHANRGGGSLSADLNDAARALSWARQLPGSQRWLGDIQTQGRASLQARWRGGWRDPAIEARLSVPTLAGRVTGSPPLQLRDVLLTADGRLAQARWSARGEIAQGERRVQLSLSASGGRSTPEAPLAASGWRLRLDAMQASLRDPALGAGTWQLASRRRVPLSWSPARGGQLRGRRRRAQRQLPAPTAQALLTWGPLRWQDGELSSTGRLSGLPLQWVERLAGAPLRDAGLSGDVVFDGGWSATLGRQPAPAGRAWRAPAATSPCWPPTPETGVQSRVAAGLREARLTLRSQGRRCRPSLRWDSERAGTADGQLRSTNWPPPARRRRPHQLVLAPERARCTGSVQRAAAAHRRLVGAGAAGLAPGRRAGGRAANRRHAGRPGRHRHAERRRHGAALGGRRPAVSGWPAARAAGRHAAADRRVLPGRRGRRGQRRTSERHRRGRLARRPRPGAAERHLAAPARERARRPAAERLGHAARRPGRPRPERRRAPERGPGADRAARRQPPGAG
jgi:translocation and assembly module TamB